MQQLLGETLAVVPRLPQVQVGQVAVLALDRDVHDQLEPRRGRSHLHQRGSPAAAVRELETRFIGQPYLQTKTEETGSAYTQTTVEYQHQVYSIFTGSSEDSGWRVTIAPRSATANRQ